MFRQTDTHDKAKKDIDDIGRENSSCTLLEIYFQAIPPDIAIDNQKASDLINAFEEKQLLTQLIDDTNTEGKNEIKVYIGEESPIQTMKDCSIVTANYEFGDGMRGMIGIIGPKRMDYDKVVGTIKTIKSQLDMMYKKDED